MQVQAAIEQNAALIQNDLNLFSPSDFRKQNFELGLPSNNSGKRVLTFC
jgi:hypothetical protein